MVVVDRPRYQGTIAGKFLVAGKITSPNIEWLLPNFRKATLKKESKRMRKCYHVYLLFAIFLISSPDLTAQPELSYLRVFDNSGFLNAFQPYNFLSSEDIYITRWRYDENPGFPFVWNSNQPLPMSFPAQEDAEAFIFYGSDLGVIGKIDFNQTPIINKSISAFGEDVLMFFGSNSTLNDPLLSFPAIENQSGNEGSEFRLIRVSPTQNTASELMDIRSFTPSSNSMPYPGYRDATATSTVIPQGFATATLVNQGLHISALSLDTEQHLNGTLEFSPLLEHAGYLWLSTDLQTGVTEGIPIVSSAGNHSSYAMYAGYNGQSLAHFGVVRGHDVKVSPSGPHWMTFLGDSLYYTYVSKLGSDGALEWITAISGLNNKINDTISTIPGDSFLAQLATSIYGYFPFQDYSVFNYRTFSRLALGDSLLYIDIWGEENMVANATLNILDQVALDRIAITKVSDAGAPLVELSANLPKTANFVTDIFDFGEHIAWTFNHESLNDTTYAFSYKEGAGAGQILPVDLPAGIGASILWLDHDLKIQDHWVIRVEEGSTGRINIRGVSPFGTDTILIQGVCKGNVISSFEIGTSSELQELSTNDGFMAFYHQQGFLNTLDQPSMLPYSKVFPNPSKGELHLQASQGGHIQSWAIFDISGRVVLSGKAAETDVDIHLNVPNGVYIIEITVATEKVERHKLVISD